MANARHSKAGRFVQQRLFCDLSDFVELERRIAALPDEQSRGAAFEVFAEAYLATQRKYDATQVWPHGSVPLDILKNLGLTQQDQGVDGVLQTLLGQFNAYQIKFRTGRPSLTWRELSTFIGLADSPHIHNRVLLTNCDELPAVLNERQGFFCIRGSDLDRLEADDFRAMEAWLAGAAFIAPKKSPQPHQTEALDALLPALQTHDRVSAIMACGTGKTLVALWVTERLEAKRVLVLLPSLALLRQTLHEWLRETHLPNLAYLCVCSDPTVKEGIDALTTQQSDLDFQVSTDTASVRSFLDAPFAGVKMIFSTYQSAYKVGEAMKPGEAFDFAVFDEAHKTAGREGRNNAFALDDKNLFIRKRLFVTATPRHYNPLNKNKDGDAQLVFSMDNAETYGPQIYRLPFSKAAKRGIICRYKVVISVITSQQVTNELLSHGEVLVNGDAIRARQVANQIALKEAVAKYGVNKIFTFHSTVASAASFTSRGNEGVAIHLPDFKTLHVNGKMPTAAREREMRDFRNCKRGIISNARCLTEGVDVPAVDMVAFLAPRRSRVDIVQATGRAMRLDPANNKTTGYILVPLYLEQATNESVEEAVLRSDFSEVWEVLQSLQEQDEVLSEIIRDMRMERGRTKGFDDSRFREQVTILGPSVSLEALRQSITAACLDAIGEKWFERYAQLHEYQKEHGNCDMPARWPTNQKLATWVVNQRVLQKEGKLEQDKIALLDRIGFKWSPHASTWRTYYLALLDYRNSFGNCFVPLNWKENKKLARWVSSQRVDYVRNKLSSERIALLEKIGFEWTGGVATWDERFAELCAYKERFGHTLVPVKWKENQLLGGWVSAQRYKGNQGKLNKEFETRLNSIGFVWKVPRIAKPAEVSTSKLEEQWLEMFGRFKEYAAVHGVSRIEVVDDETRKLNRWMLGQRQARKRGKLNEARIRALDEIGFEWKGPRISNPAKFLTHKYESLWLEMFGRFKEYAAVHGSSSIKVIDDATRKLNRWIIWQRQARKLGKLSDARIQALDGIGFVWQRIARKFASKPNSTFSEPEILKRSWDELFSDLTDFYKLHGHCNVAPDWPANPELAVWVGLQRGAKRRNRLTADQLRRMDDIGFAWSIHDGDWDVMFAKLVEYLRPMHNGKPRNVAMSAELRRWTLTQRQFKNRGELEPERERKLNSIGFDWQPHSRQWQEMFDALRKFHADNGHCRVPSKWPRNPKLASWVATQRARKSSGMLSAERMASLDVFGFSWRIGSSGAKPTAETWDAMFLMLEQYKQAHGNCLVPQRFKGNPKLADWVSEQRMAYNRGQLAAERTHRLDKLGFDWDPNNTHWEKYYRQLVEFKKEHNHTNVPQRSGKYRELGTWVRNQRAAKRYKRPIMAERAKRLDEIGFIWVLIEPMSWEKMFAALVEYQKVHKHCNVPQKAGEYKRLGKWVNTQRTRYYRGKFRVDRKQLLDSIGFVWNLRPNLAAAR